MKYLIAALIIYSVIVMSVSACSPQRQIINVYDTTYLDEDPPISIHYGHGITYKRIEDTVYLEVDDKVWKRRKNK